MYSVFSESKIAKITLSPSSFIWTYRRHGTVGPPQVMVTIFFGLIVTFGNLVFYSFSLMVIFTVNWFSIYSVFRIRSPVLARNGVFCGCTPFEFHLKKIKKQSSKVFNSRHSWKSAPFFPAHIGTATAQKAQRMKQLRPLNAISCKPRICLDTVAK